RSKRAASTRSASRPVSSGSGAASVPGAMQDRIAQPGVVLLAGRGQDYRFGQLRANETLAFERGPDRRVAQAGRVARGDDCLAKMEMIAMRVGQFGDRDPAGLVLRCRLAGELR